MAPDDPRKSGSPTPAQPSGDSHIRSTDDKGKIEALEVNQGPKTLAVTGEVDMDEVRRAVFVAFEGTILSDLLFTGQIKEAERVIAKSPQLQEALLNAVAAHKVGIVDGCLFLEAVLRIVAWTHQNMTQNTGGMVEADEAGEVSLSAGGLNKASGFYQLVAKMLRAAAGRMNRAQMAVAKRSPSDQVDIAGFLTMARSFEEERVTDGPHQVIIEDIFTDERIAAFQAMVDDPENPVTELIRPPTSLRHLTQTTLGLVEQMVTFEVGLRSRAATHEAADKFDAAAGVTQRQRALVIASPEEATQPANIEKIQKIAQSAVIALGVLIVTLADHTLERIDLLADQVREIRLLLEDIPTENRAEFGDKLRRFFASRGEETPALRAG